MNWCVYKIVNNKTGRAYFGITQNFPERKRYHISRLKNNVHINKALQSDYNKSGGKFVFSVIKRKLNRVEANQFERLIINKADCYNSNKGGGGRMPEPDKKKPIILYVRESVIEKHGGEESLKKEIYEQHKII